MPLYKADFDKPHRCPKCWLIPIKMWDYKPSWLHRKIRYAWIYKCAEGHRWTKMPLPFRHDGIDGMDRAWSLRGAQNIRRLRRRIRRG